MNNQQWRGQDEETNEAYNHVLQAMAILMSKDESKCEDELDDLWDNNIEKVCRWARELNGTPIVSMAEMYPSTNYNNLQKWG